MIEIMKTRPVSGSGLHRLLAGLVVCLTAGPVFADAPPEKAAAWEWGFTLGVNSWSDLGDVQSTLGGDFDEYGFALDMFAHKEVGQWGSAAVLFGADLGFFSTDSGIPGIFEGLVQRGVYLTPSVKLRFGERGKGHINLDAGAGWYNTDFAELNCSNYNPFIGGPICTEIGDSFDANAFGGYVGVSGGFNRTFTMGLRVHFADFGDVTGLPTVSGKLGGPIYTLNFGAVF